MSIRAATVGEHPLIDGLPPPWATEWGDDRRGVFTAFAVDGVAYRLRWIPPGRFVMGSPASFVRALNARVPALDARLPTEAEWERACRAETTTATWAGDLVIVGDNHAPVLDAIAWYGGNSGVGFDLADGEDSSTWTAKQHPHTRAGTRPVGEKQPTPTASTTRSATSTSGAKTAKARPPPRVASRAARRGTTSHASCGRRIGSRSRRRCGRTSWACVSRWMREADPPATARSIKEVVSAWVNHGKSKMEFDFSSHEHGKTEVIMGFCFSNHGKTEVIFGFGRLRVMVNSW